jgi:hypothetical protein
MTTTTQMIFIVSFMLAINVALALFQGAVSEVNPLGVQFFDVADSPYSNYVANGTLIADDSYLPIDDDVSGGTSGNVFTDTYQSIKSWTQKTLAPLKFVANVLEQPYGFLKDINLPSSVALAIGVFWYMLAILIIVSWWTGR